MQPELRRPYSEVVWYQSERLEAHPDPTELARVQSSIAYLLTQQPDLVKKMPHKPLHARDGTEMARLDAVHAAVASGVSDPPTLGTPIPTSIALWPLDEKKRAIGNIPVGSGWVGTRSPKYIFRDRSGENEIGYFEYFEPRVDGAPLILSSFDHAPPAPSNPKPRLGKICTLFGLVFFLLALGGAMGTGGVIADAHRVVVSAKSDVDAQFEARLQKYCNQSTNLCAGQSAAQVLATCTPMIAPKMLENDAEIELSRLCSAVWDQALVASDGLREFSRLDAYAGVAINTLTFLHRDGASMAKTESVSVVPYFVLSMLGLILLFMGLGFWTSGRGAGIAISAQNRLSLSLLQITAWTTVILSAYATYCAFNVGAIGTVYLTVDTPTASLFPQLEAWTWAVMGIVVASPTLSALIKGAKPSVAEGAGEPEQVTETLNLTLGPLSRNLSSSQASFLDIFLGEDKANDTKLDISRAQNVIITALLLFTFTGWLLHLMGGINVQTFLEAFVIAGPVLSRFPDPGATFTALLALTHAAYLAGKWKPKN